MAIYNVAETTNISGKCFSMIYGDAIENGSVVKKGAIMTDEREIYAADIPAIGDEVFLVANPAWNYDDGRVINQNEDAYINVANKPFRTYGLLASHHDRFGVMDYGITPAQASGEDLAPAVGDYIGVDTTTTKLKNLGATAPVDADDRGFIGKIVDINNYGYAIPTGTAGTISTATKMVVIEVIKNETV